VTQAEIDYILSELAKEFMRPFVDRFDRDPACLDGEPCESEERAPGWYHRLSAPGYLDRTDWIGPFETEAEARADCAAYWSYLVDLPPMLP
jgi:hypothetical protein